MLNKIVKLLTAAYSPTRQWNVGVINKPIQSFIDEKEYEVEWFPTPDRKHFLADPFGAKINGDSYVFMEECDHNKMKGKISYIKLSERNKPLKLKTAIEKPYHMSYPYLFQYKNEVYCIPETCGNNEATIYKITDPSNWEKKHTIIKGIDVVDPSIIEYNGKWWLFFTRVKTGDCTNLYLWYTEELFGEWKPHKNNPVKTDISSSRPAGTMFIHEGTLYRPAQNCAEFYGANIVINKVLKISPMEFLEESVLTINPNSTALNGVHTLSSLGEITLIDGDISLDRDKLWLKNKILNIFKYLS